MLFPTQGDKKSEAAAAKWTATEQVEGKPFDTHYLTAFEAAQKQAGKSDIVPEMLRCDSPHAMGVKYFSSSPQDKKEWLDFFLMYDINSRDAYFPQISKSNRFPIGFRKPRALFTIFTEGKAGKPKPQVKDPDALEAEVAKVPHGHTYYEFVPTAMLVVLQGGYDLPRPATIGHNYLAIEEEMANRVLIDFADTE